RMEEPSISVRIGLVGKYVDLPDAYLSVIEALKAGGYAANAEVEIVWVASDEDGSGAGTALDRSRSGIVPGHLSSGGPEQISSLDGICVPGGFGIRGIEARSRPSASPVRRGSRSSGSAWGCSAR